MEAILIIGFIVVGYFVAEIAFWARRIVRMLKKMYDWQGGAKREWSDIQAEERGE